MKKVIHYRSPLVYSIPFYINSYRDNIYPACYPISRMVHVATQVKNRITPFKCRVTCKHCLNIIEENKRFQKLEREITLEECM